MLNDRIYELARQADLIEFKPVGDSDNWTPDYESIVKARKFARLLLQECAEHALYGDEFEQARANIQLCPGVELTNI